MSHRIEDIQHAAALSGLSKDIDPTRLGAFQEILQLIEIRDAAVTPFKAEEIGTTTFTQKISVDARTPADDERCTFGFSLRCVLLGTHTLGILSSPHRFDITQIPGQTIGNRSEHDTAVSREDYEKLQRTVERVRQMVKTWETQTARIDFNPLEAAAEMRATLRTGKQCPMIFKPGPGQDDIQCINDEHDSTITHTFDRLPA